MRRSLISSLTFVALFATQLRPSAAAASPPPIYSIAELISAPIVNSYTTAINDSGQVTCYGYDTAGVVHGFVYDHGIMVEISPGSGKNLFPMSINSSGAVAGTAATSTGVQPNYMGFIFSDGVRHDLGPIFGAATCSVRGINDSGQVVGSAKNPAPYDHAYLWSAGTAKDLGTLNGPSSYALGINNSGQVVGQATGTSPDSRGFIYSDGKMTDIGILPTGTSSIAYAITSNGLVAGTATVADPTYPWIHNDRAVLFSNGVLKNLGTLGGNFSHGFALNIDGTVVGHSDLASHQDLHAFIYTNGAMADLNSVLPPDSQWTLDDAMGINRYGQIVGSGMHAGSRRGYFLSPVPQVTSVSPVTAGQGTLINQFSVQGVSLAGATSIEFWRNGAVDPTVKASGLLVNQGGTSISATVAVAANAVLGARTVVVTTICGNSSTLPSSQSTLTVVDKVVPAITLINPAAGVTLAAISGINGTANDEPSGSGLARVDLLLRRNADGIYWTGSAWGSTSPTALATILSGTQWKHATALPSATSSDPSQVLFDGSYTVTATAYDKANNRAAVTRNILVDRVAPVSVIVTTPAAASCVASLPKIVVSVQDNAGGSGVGRVDLFLRRNTDALYWNGSAWGTTRPVALPMAASNGFWIRTGGLPVAGSTDSALALVEGGYSLAAYAYDKAGNKATGGGNFSVDFTLPVTVLISTPLAGSSIAALTSVNGSASDNAGGSGIGHVDLYLKRASDGHYWTGSAWGTAMPAPLTTTLQGTAWKRAGGLPLAASSDPAQQLTVGNYSVYAYAYDRAGNLKITRNDFKVAASASPAASLSDPTTTPSGHEN